MLSNDNPDQKEKLTPWVIGAFMIAVIGVGAYMNYGGELFHHATDISATSPAKPGE
jgi:hypothetical protein